MVRGLVCAALMASALSSYSSMAVKAASFDCAKASTPFEQAICGDDDLSTADERLAKTYATAIGGLSEFALTEMRTSQRAWLDYAQRACTRDAEPMASGTYDEWGLRCLRDVFNGRSRALEMSRMIDGDRYYPLAQFSVQQDPDEADNPDSNWPVAQHELTMVQIDGEEPYARTFNQLVQEEGALISTPFAAQGGPETMTDDTSSDTSNSIAVERVAGRNLISLEVNTYWYGHGAAHGNYAIYYKHFLKEQERFLEAGDMFQGKGWQRALLGLVVEAAKAEHGDNLMLDDTTYIAESVIDPSRWNLSDPYGLVIQFQPYEISAYAYGAPTTRVTWEALAPYLTENADRIRRGY
ncbi:DUF3298 domain-containing protein [Devosia sediminis]|uniref:DUF1311 domain-containing protein n=1 Tax=Devosia sediminis TaxID=2798801 RepID=A0A934IX45_9HYPH|nr:DUF3298 domain-containing protein [Devosia sediminis]MBJ3786696.1 DUF1311 domain-containing protein [Devosia sediminis]